MDNEYYDLISLSRGVESARGKFEDLVYKIFKKEFYNDDFIEKFENHKALERKPIIYKKKKMGFQAKFLVDGSLSSNKGVFIKAINKIVDSHKELDCVCFYVNKNWGNSDKNGELKYKKEIEEKARGNGLEIFWIMGSEIIEKARNYNLFSQYFKMPLKLNEELTELANYNGKQPFIKKLLKISKKINNNNISKESLSRLKDEFKDLLYRLNVESGVQFLLDANIYNDYEVDVNCLEFLKNKLNLSFEHRKMKGISEKLLTVYDYKDLNIIINLLNKYEKYDKRLKEMNEFIKAIVKYEYKDMLQNYILKQNFVKSNFFYEKLISSHEVENAFFSRYYKLGNCFMVEIFASPQNPHAQIRCSSVYNEPLCFQQKELEELMSVLKNKDYYFYNTFSNILNESLTYKNLKIENSSYEEISNFFDSDYALAIFLTGEIFRFISNGSYRHALTDHEFVLLVKQYFYNVNNCKNKVLEEEINKNLKHMKTTLNFENNYHNSQNLFKDYQNNIIDCIFPLLRLCYFLMFDK